MRTLAALAALILTPAASQALDPHVIRSPSDNIHCMAFAEGSATEYTSVSCEIANTSSPPALPRPRDCDQEWGGRFSVAQTGRSEMICHGDTLRADGTPILKYGSAVQFGGITCALTESGLECINASGHGFFLSKARQRLF